MTYLKDLARRVSELERGMRKIIRIDDKAGDASKFGFNGLREAQAIAAALIARSEA